MTDCRLGEIESRFAALIWDNEPIASGELVRLCERELNWKKSTTYTVLRRLCQRGLFENSGGEVRSRVSREEYLSACSADFVNTAFDGSLPRFLTAFAAKKRLTDTELEELEALIARHRGETSC